MISAFEQIRAYEDAAPTILERISEWAEAHPYSESLHQFFVNIHEGCHVAYYRDLGFDPKVYGPRFIQDRYTYGSVEGLPWEISLNPRVDPVLIGKAFLGPMYLQLLLTPDEDYKEEIMEDTETDRMIFNDWLMRRSGGPDINGMFASMIRDAVHADYKNPEFHQRIWAAALEYEEKVREKKPN